MVDWWVLSGRASATSCPERPAVLLFGLVVAPPVRVAPSVPTLIEVDPEEQHPAEEGNSWDDCHNLERELRQYIPAAERQRPAHRTGSRITGGD